MDIVTASDDANATGHWNRTFADVAVAVADNASGTSWLTDGDDVAASAADERAALLYFIICGVLICSIGVFGVIGNVLSLCILCRREMRSSINLYLCALTVYDTLLILTAILGFGIPSIPSYTGHLMTYLRAFPYMIRYIYPVALLAQTGSVWITVSVTVERYIAVVHPLRARSWCTMTRAKVVIATVSALALVYNVPRYFETAIAMQTDPATNETYAASAPSELRRNDVYIEVYYVWLYLPFMNVIPFLALAILNSIIMLTVRKARSQRFQMTRHQKKEVNTAMMLVCIVAIFFVCNIMTVLINIIEHAGSFQVDDPVVVHVSNLLVTFNSSVNFAIYSIFGQKFRHMFLRIFCRRPQRGVTNPRAYVMKQRQWHSECEHNGSGRADSTTGCYGNTNSSRSVRYATTVADVAAAVAREHSETTPGNVGSGGGAVTTDGLCASPTHFAAMDGGGDGDGGDLAMTTAGLTYRPGENDNLLVNCKTVL